MSEIKIAKDLFIQKGQIKDRIINKELSVSWRRCKMYGLFPNSSVQIDDDFDNDDSEFSEYCDRVIPEFISFFISNREGKVLYRRVDTDVLKVTDLSEKVIGTTSFSITAISKKDALVKKEEHYLELLEIYTSRSIVIPSEDLVITLFYKGAENEYIYMSVKNSVVSFASEGFIKGGSEKKPVALSDYLKEEEYRYDELLDHLIEPEGKFPILIIGKDSDALAWFFADKNSYSTLRVSHKGIPEALMEEKLIEASKKSTALIIADLNSAPEKYLTLVAQIVDFMIESGDRKKKQIYLTSSERLKSDRIIQKLQMSTIELDSFLMDPSSGFHFKTIEEVESEIIGATLVATNWNPTEAAKKLGIGRATLYRKMKLYHYENSTKVSR